MAGSCTYHFLEIESTLVGEVSLTQFRCTPIRVEIRIVLDPLIITRESRATTARLRRLVPLPPYPILRSRRRGLRFVGGLVVGFNRWFEVQIVAATCGLVPLPETLVRLIGNVTQSSTDLIAVFAVGLYLTDCLLGLGLSVSCHAKCGPCQLVGGFVALVAILQDAQISRVECPRRRDQSLGPASYKFGLGGALLKG